MEYRSRYWDVFSPRLSAKKQPAHGSIRLRVEGDRMLERTGKGMFARLRLAANWRQINGPLFRKYVALFLAVVFIVLLTNVLFEVAFSYQEQKAALIRIQREQAEAAAAKIGQFIKEIESQVGWTTQLPWSAGTLDQRRFDGLRLLRQVPAITELAQLDSAGKEQLRVSRLAMDVIRPPGDGGNDGDYSRDPKFTEAAAHRVYYGPVYFRRESEPYMTLSLAGTGRDAGVSVAEVNLKLIWDVVSQIKVGEHGQAYVIDAEGRLIAHPDISLVLRNTDMTQLPQVAAARAATADGTAARPDSGIEQVQAAKDLRGHEVLTAYAPVAPLGWLLFVELPVEEAYAPLYAAIERSGALLLAGLALAFFSGLFLARRMVIPIQALRAGAARIGGGDLAQRIAIRTGDELEALADQFNSMAAQLQDSYAGLERKVEQRTDQLQQANLAKSRFLAAASHDLRQPLQALGMFVAQLQGQMKTAEGSRLVERIDAAVGAMNELFNALLDISKLDAGVLSTNITELPVNHVLKRIENTFTGAAREKGLSFRIVPSSAWVRSDVILLERIILNLCSNALRYTSSGGVVVGCRHRGHSIRIEIYDSGPGIPEDQRRNIFGEFYRLAGENRHGGLGLGLAIVERLCVLLDHPIEVTSIVGKGSRFAVTVPSAPARQHYAAPQVTAPVAADISRGKVVVVIDDDALVLDSVGGILRSWGCKVITADSLASAASALAGEPRPDLIISDYRLADGQSGIAAIAKLRDAFGPAIPAFLMSGDTAPERLREAQESGHHLLHKPVRPMRLRAMVNQLLKGPQVAGAP
ncbi:MAG TPA: ATP-binding protein [Xanthobacteraceae bacterium]|jgi:signal transduction histidine kinase/CheY-like chemotaxis protein